MQKEQKTALIAVAPRSLGDLELLGELDPCPVISESICDRDQREAWIWAAVPGRQRGWLRTGSGRRTVSFAPFHPAQLQCASVEE